MLTPPQIRALVIGIVGSNNSTKQRLGQRFASCLGLEPGPGGPDDGVDGWLEYEGKRIHFQSKLSSYDLDKDEARRYYADLKHHEPDVTIMLAGVGFKETFVERLFGYPDVSREHTHLLTLRDLFLETEAYQKAAQHLPALARLAKLLMSVDPVA